MTGKLNPIFWQEHIHQQRSAPRSNLLVKLLPVSLFLLIAIGLPLTLLDFDLAWDATVNLAMISTWAFHAVVATRAIIAGANVISREHVGQTWDSLVLTGMSAPRILFGKWRAALRRIAPWIFALGVIRLIVLPVLMAALTARLSYFFYQRNGAYSSYGSGPGMVEQSFFFAWNGEVTLLAPIAAVILTYIETAACVAIGIAASAITRRGMAAMALAVTIRFVPVALLIGLTRHERGVNQYLWYRFPAFALADGGTSQLYQFMVPNTPWTEGRITEALPNLVLVAILLSLMLLAAYLVAYYAIGRSGAFWRQGQKQAARSFRLASSGDSS